jgi:nitrogen regulatory protein PII
MKLLLIIHDVDFDEDVMEALSTCGIKGYTKWDRVLGKGERSEPKMDNAVWPGFNCCIVAAIEDEIEEKVMESLQTLFSKFGGKRFKVFELPLLKVI